MITLPNGDKWILDDEEIKNIPYERAKQGYVPATTIEDFLDKLLNPQPEDCFLPRKLTEKFGGYWDCNFNVHYEVLSAIAINITRTDFLTACEMADGKVYVIFTAPD
jgi:hypothetical protein